LIERCDGLGGLEGEERIHGSLLLITHLTFYYPLHSGVSDLACSAGL
jgi:hypothetical protein